MLRAICGKNGKIDNEIQAVRWKLLLIEIGYPNKIPVSGRVTFLQFHFEIVIKQIIHYTPDKTVKCETSMYSLANGKYVFKNSFIF